MGFFPAANENYLKASYVSQEINSTIKASGTKYSDTRNASNYLDLLFGHAFTQNFELDVQWNFNISSIDAVTYAADGSTADIKKTGMYDPYFIGKYRLLAGGSGSLNLDVSLGYSPKFFEARIGTIRKDGAVSRGREEKMLGLLLTKKSDSFEYGVRLKRALLDDGTEEDLSTNPTTTNTNIGGGDTSLSLLGQFKLSSLLIGFDYNLGALDSYTKKTSSGNRTEFESRNYSAFGFKLGFEANDSLGLFLHYLRTTVENSRSRGASSLEYTDYNSTLTSLGVIAKF